MSKYNLSWDENKLKRYIKEGRGQGIGKDYKPWITVHDFPSNGFSSRQPGWKSNRVCHFLSHNELRYFYMLEWSDVVTDIREQFPMDLEETLDIADNLGIKHPENRGSKTPYIMTSDFMITLNVKGKEIYKVRTIKPTSELEKKNCIEHFEIERRYWAAHDIDWGIVTDNDIPKTMVSNIEWAYYSYNLESENDLSLKELLYYGELLKDKLERTDGRLVHIAAKFDKEMNLEPGTSLDIVKHLIAHKEIVMDLQAKRCVESSTHSIKRIIKKNDRLAVI
ncbi:MAG: TnsA endonuclease N-terminal domain-containing protein [Clostridia bacterium]|nr:TnsA endonuclease N-terminal domain-containing protein [Clostridia bacterium]